MVHARLRASGLSLLCLAILFIFQKLISTRTHAIFLEKNTHMLCYFLGRRIRIANLLSSGGLLDCVVLNCNFANLLSTATCGNSCGVLGQRRSISLRHLLWQLYGVEWLKFTSQNLPKTKGYVRMYIESRKSGG